ncbi:Alpha-tocopherol transfer protein-like [Armadillidium nasatum]|uniref:Alpha-tocopherol transfer protein-like n=1 Tax=Armadillidium nasatum TaxID=96803 RepID=A0A5N5SQJ5_9CRUS|nr:Alpha-tocopherol transfer protein-like [Armadillidium nasatum]
MAKSFKNKPRKNSTKTPKGINDDIEYIRKWIKKQPHLHIRTDDYFILRFLRGCKFSLEKTKQKIDMHYTLKAMIPEWFQNRDPEDPKIREILKLGVMLPLKDADDKGRRIFICRNSVYDPKEYTIDELTKAIYILIDVFYEVDEIHQITGIVMIMDLKGTTAAHFLQFSPSAMKKSTVLWQDGYVTRNKCLHYVNVNSYFESMFKIFSVFLNEKMKSRIKMHGSDYEEIYKDIPKRIMPEEYGGEGGSMKELAEHWLKIIDSKRKWLLEDHKNTVDESKRPGKPKKSEDVFGIDGSFRKLNVD